MLKITLIALGGALGAVLRYLIAGGVQRLGRAEGFPTGTLFVNVVGCFAAGFLVALFASPHTIREEYRLALLIGLLGGFTTFSTFAKETLSFIEDGQWTMAAANVLISNSACLVGVWLGYRIAQRIYGA